VGNKEGGNRGRREEGQGGGEKGERDPQHGQEQLMEAFRFCGCISTKKTVG
jgi:hypothetical protein